ncbi:MAG: metalloregulator ArsR/SmtB family transcription factor [Pseudomonadota bacterium]
MTSSETLDTAFAALAHPVRRAMLSRLTQGGATVNDLAAPFDMTLPAVSRHIRVLENAGFVTRSKTAQFRPCTLNPAPLQEIATWAEQYRPIWEGRFDAMDAFLKDMKESSDD